MDRDRVRSSVETTQYSVGDVAVDTADRPYVLIWEVTQACDLRCDHCRADAQPDRHPNELTTRDGKAMLTDIQHFNDNQLVVLSGGDPLKRDDLFELIAFGSSLGLRMTITPSGTNLLTEERIRALRAAGITRIALSLDGASADTHDSFRGETGSFDETIDALDHATTAGIPIQVNTTVCAETVDELEGICERIEATSTVLWSVFFLVPIGRGAQLTSLQPKVADNVMEWLVETRDRVSFAVKTTEAPQFRRVALQSNSNEPPGPGSTHGIIAGDGFVFVSHTGDVYPSGFLPLSAGNVRSNSVVEIYRNSHIFRQLRDRSELKGKCGACPYRFVCGGSRSRAFATTGDPLESDPLCPYIPPQYRGPLPWSPTQK